MQGHDAYPDPSARSPGAHGNGNTATTVDTSVSVLEPYTPPNVSHGLAPRGPLRHPLQHGPAAGGVVPDHHDRPVRGRARGGVSGQLHPGRDLPDRVPSHSRALDQPGRPTWGYCGRNQGGAGRTGRATATRSWARTGVGRHCQWASRIPTPSSNLSADAYSIPSYHARPTAPRRP